MHGDLVTRCTACPAGPAGDDTLVREGDKLPADSLVLSTKNIWSIIKSQKDLNLPAHKVRRIESACTSVSGQASA